MIFLLCNDITVSVFHLRKSAKVISCFSSNVFLIFSSISVVLRLSSPALFLSDFLSWATETRSFPSFKDWYSRCNLLPTWKVQTLTTPLALQKLTTNDFCLFCCIRSSSLESPCPILILGCWLSRCVCLKGKVYWEEQLATTGTGSKEWQLSSYQQWNEFHSVRFCDRRNYLTI